MEPPIMRAAKAGDWDAMLAAAESDPSAVFGLDEDGASPLIALAAHPSVADQRAYELTMKLAEYARRALGDSSSGRFVREFVEKRDGYFYSTPLMFAVEVGNTGASRALLELNADPHADNGCGASVLMCCVRTEYAKYAKFGTHGQVPESEEDTFQVESEERPVSRTIPFRSAVSAHSLVESDEDSDSDSDEDDERAEKTEQKVVEEKRATSTASAAAPPLTRMPSLSTLTPADRRKRLVKMRKGICSIPFFFIVSFFPLGWLE